MSAAEKKFTSGEEYLAWEREANFKSEYIHGEIFAMAGAGLNHNMIVLNLAAEIRSQLRGKPCRVMSADMKVQVDAANSYFYPDISGLCGEFEFQDERDDTYRNPQFVIEVLSDSTESFDRGKKFFYYQMLPSLKEYVLISQKMATVEVYRKDENRWIYQLMMGEDAVLKLESVGCEVPFSEIFLNVNFPAENLAPVSLDVPQ